jgi:FkbM family methyltransferase
MLNVVTVEVGDYLGHGADYVERLHDMVRRNLANGFKGRFVVLTDSVERYKGMAGVEARALPPDVPRSWWAKMWLFHPDTFEAGERVLYLDLDTCITGPLDAIAEYCGAFGILRDVYRPGGLQSSVMAFETGTKLIGAIWRCFCSAESPLATEPLAQRFPGGDQQMLEYVWGKWLPAEMQVDPNRVWPPDRLQDHYPGMLQSYKAACTAEVPKGTAIVFFHGNPRPHEVSHGWVPEVWKVGGGSSMELVMVPNVAQETILQHIRINTGMVPAEQHFEVESEDNGRTAVIVGGGPSLAGFIPLIADLQRQGMVILATNATDGYLRGHGITPEAHLVIDAREAMIETYQPGGQKIYASMVHPRLMEKALRDAAATVVMWHPLTDGSPELLPQDTPLIGGGTTIGIKTMVLAYAMGFRQLYLVGFDSCYQDGDHHAYAQSLNDGERVIDVICRGRAFKCAPWMIQQSEDFKQVSALLLNQGCAINVLGDGLIPWIAGGMIEHPPEPYTQHKGLWWPTLDEEARPAVLGTLPDCIAYADLARKHRTVIQAGGNVGAWALELAKRFESVCTFEPDPDNWACLVRNIGKTANINAWPFALGDQEVTGYGIQRQIGNCGATRVTLEAGDVQVMKIDSLRLTALDLLILDVEGFEQLALMGAERTLATNSPVIVLELKGLGEQYGYTDADTVAWLAARGYEVSGHRHRDVIFTKRGHFDG